LSMSGKTYPLRVGEAEKKRLTPKKKRVKKE
jgi:hypothetical protein